MSTTMIETGAIAAAPAAISPPPVIAEQGPSALRIAKAVSVAPDMDEVTFLDDHPLVPVFVIGVFAMIMALIAVGSIVFWLVIRYSGVLAP